MLHRTRSLRSLCLLPILLAVLAPRTALASDEHDAAAEAAGMVMVLVPAGTYTVGSTPQQLDAAVALCEAERRSVSWCPESFASYEARHATVELDAFYIDTFEVTVDAYAACVDAGGCAVPDLDACLGVDTMKNWGKLARGAHPMGCVTWDEARTYCEWAGKRLPTGDEWEAAARGTDGRTFPWGDAVPSEAGLVGNFADATIYAKNPDWSVVANYDDGHLITAPVGSFPNGASPFGVQDMAGNVAEWTADASEDGVSRAVRGGAYLGSAAYMRSALRLEPSVDKAGGDVGFRCAMSP